MATQTIQAHLRQRVDTKANWEAANPVLLDGELGFIKDYPGQYKLGDGVSSWNALPVRGLSINVKQSIGTDADAVMSQKAVTEALDQKASVEVEAQIEDLREQLSRQETDPVFSDSPAARITDEDIENWNAGTGENPGAISSEYTSAIEDKDVAMTQGYGDFKAGTTVADLEGKTFSELFDGIFFPSVDPSHSSPSLLGFALSPATSPVELGTAVAAISAAGLNKGAWTNFNDGLAYAGDVTNIAYAITINGTSYTGITNLPETYKTLGNQTYRATVNYAAGPTPVNNKGVARPTLAAPANSVSATRTVNVTAPWYASTETSGTLTKQALVAWNAAAGEMSTGSNGFTLMPHTAEAPQMFKLPRKAASIQMLNTVSNQFEAMPLDEWVEASGVESVNGVNQTYYTYTYKGDARSSVKLIVKF